MKALRVWCLKHRLDAARASQSNDLKRPAERRPDRSQPPDSPTSSDTRGHDLWTPKAGHYGGLFRRPFAGQIVSRNQRCMRAPSQYLLSQVSVMLFEAPQDALH